ncbi:hypothetical protein [Luteimonas deserti]|uniref:Uncharacterized protein n=1 Tax=Luteimonas deserti TaxID=2752306 RepID=A0A7Z0QSA5_9GAMM|nr:hypothetical protein [Luteimonas deserti]NYZ62865.1 hypothetical protein [Luteimonas deserti]
MSSHRRHRFSRQALRRGEAGVAARLGLAGACVGGLWWGLGRPDGAVFWSFAGLYLVYAAWQAVRERRFERQRWEVKRRYEVWFEPGVMHVAVPLVPGESLPLDSIVNIEAIIERSRVTRLLVDDRSGERAIYSGFEDMAAFAHDFRDAAPHAPFRNMRMGFFMRLREIR